MPRNLAYARIFPSFLALLLFCIITWLLSCIALSSMFEREGIQKWKAFIPLYNIYVLSKLVWETKYSWFITLPTIAIPLLACIRLGSPWSIIFLLLIIVLFIVVLIFFYRLMLCLSRHYGKNIAFALGLLFFNCIFMLVLVYHK